MKHDLPSWPRVAVAAAVVVVLGAGVTGAAVIVGATDDADDPGGTIGADGISLVSYNTCETALAELRDRVLPHVTPWGLELGSGGVLRDAVPMEGGAAEDRAAAPAAPADGDAAAGGKASGDSAGPGNSTGEQSKEHSSTNTHEAGVDEPDLVKTDGARVISIADGVLRVVDVASRKQTAAVTLPGGYATQLLLSGDRALVLTAAGMAMDGGIAPGKVVPDTSPPVKPMPTGYGAQLALVDLTGAGAVLGTLAVDGGYLDARQVGAVARVVVRSQPRMEFAYPQDEKSTAAALLENQSVVRSSTIADWLPRYELTSNGRTTSGQLTDCASVSHPADYTASSMLTVLTVDLQRELGVGEPVTIVADGNTVYGTGTSLFVADDHFAHGETDMPTASGSRTEVYQFDISAPGKPVYVASAGVEGTLLNQYSLSEHEGNLRVATTVYDGSGSQSMITVLARKGDQLAQLGKVAGLGVGERIYAVRFFGDTGYVVTFRETDPLYTVDLSDPAAPKVTGELKITGYSAYLHPAGDGRLIGVGQEATDEGRRTGAQVSLFDTADPAGARRVAQYHLAGAWTEVEGDPHAFLYWPEKGLVVLPVASGGAMAPGDPVQPMAGALVLKLNGDSFTEVGVLSHSSARYGDMPMPPRRALVIGAELWTVSEAGMLVSNLDTLAQLAWLPFG